jgi:hypothetical protein
MVVAAQKSERNTDSAMYYKNRMAQQIHRASDSTSHSPEYLANDSMYKYYSKKSTSYRGFFYSLEFTHNDYVGLDNQLKPLGFRGLSPLMLRPGFGICSKSGRLLRDLYFLNFGLQNITEKDGEKIRTSLINLMQFDYGYDLLDSRQLSVYPFAGFSLRWSTLKYNKDINTNPNFINITQPIVSSQSYSANSIRLGYQFGMGIDIKIKEDQSGARMLLSIKGGSNRALGKDKYKIHELTYRPEGMQADWLIGIGVKIVRF